MSAQDHKPYGSGGLESPFLTGELFDGEAAPEDSSVPAALQTESPFLRALEAFEERSRSADVPEAYEEATEHAREAADIFPELEEQILTLPAGLPKLPTDAALRWQLQAIGTAEARAVNAAFAVIGDPVKFSEKLPPALNAAFDSMGVPQPKLRMHVVRLGAEAFVLNTPIERATRYDNFVDHPAQLGNALTVADKRNFVHFAMWRLHQISPIVVKLPTHRRQMSRAAAMFRYFQTELASYLPIFDDKTLPRAYRTLSVQLLWRHYQALQDRVLEEAAKAPLKWTLVPKKWDTVGNEKWESLLSKEWEQDLETTALTQVEDDASAMVPTFRLTPALYRDYFNPASTSDFGYSHYTPTASPLTGDGPEMPYRSVYRRRADQRYFIEGLWKERRDDPLPKLHDTASWQTWVRQIWDSPLLRREKKLNEILRHVSGYFEAFTIHTPHDLREGCATTSYLIRTFPRAITGSLVHDCFVYAVRWLHILGRLFSPGSTPADIADPRICLVEMPAHVGVMIRADMTYMSSSRHVVIGINNKHAEVHEYDAGDYTKVSDEDAARPVVQHMYRGMKVPYLVRPLKSKPADAKALWNEVCKMSEKKLTLPYPDAKFPPHLRYLDHNATVARISRELSDAVVTSWSAVYRKLEAAQEGGGKLSPAKVRDEIRQHAENFEKALEAAVAKLEKEAKPLIQDINIDLEANKQRVLKTKGVVIFETSPFVFRVELYRRELQNAIRSGDIFSIHPAKFFPEDDFVAATQ